MTFHFRIRFPEGDITWQLVSTDQAAALHAARELVALPAAPVVITPTHPHPILQ
jgi:hypothetical protein